MTIYQNITKFQTFSPISKFVSTDETPVVTTHLVSSTGVLPFYYTDSSGNIQANFSESGYLSSNVEYWDDLRVPLDSAKLGGAKDPDYYKILDDDSGSQGVYSYGFAPNTEEELFFSVQIPHAYKEGSNICPHVHWCPSSSGDGWAIWGLEYSWANYGDSWENTTIIKSSGVGTQELSHQIVGLPEINGSGKTISSMLMCRIFRDATNDDYNYDANILEFDIHYQIDSQGSWEEYKKF